MKTGGRGTEAGAARQASVCTVAAHTYLSCFLYPSDTRTCPVRACAVEAVLRVFATFSRCVSTTTAASASTSSVSHYEEATATTATATTATETTATATDITTHDCPPDMLIS